MDYKIKSTVEIDLLSEAVVFVRDYEGDMCGEYVNALSKKFDDETLAELVAMRRRVLFAEEFERTIIHNKVGNTLYLDDISYEVIMKGLEYMRDNLRDEVVEPLYEVVRDTSCFGEVFSFSQAKLHVMREDIERNLIRFETLLELYGVFQLLC